MFSNIMVIIEIALFLLVVKNPSARKAIKSSHYSIKKMRDFSLGNRSTSHKFSPFFSANQNARTDEFFGSSYDRLYISPVHYKSPRARKVSTVRPPRTGPYPKSREVCRTVEKFFRVSW